MIGGSLLLISCLSYLTLFWGVSRWELIWLEKHDLVIRRLVLWACWCQSYVRKEEKLETEFNHMANCSISHAYIIKPQQKLWTTKLSLVVGYNTSLLQEGLCLRDTNTPFWDSLCFFIWLILMCVYMDIYIYPLYKTLIIDFSTFPDPMTCSNKQWSLQGYRKSPKLWLEV